MNNLIDDICAWLIKTWQPVPRGILKFFAGYNNLELPAMTPK